MNSALTMLWYIRFQNCLFTIHANQYDSRGYMSSLEDCWFRRGGDIDTNTDE